MKFKFANWLQHPSYFFFWLCVGVFAWSFSFGPAQLPVTDQTYQMSSFADTPNEELDFEQKMQELLDNPKAVNPEEGYEYTPEQIEETERQYAGTIDLEKDQIAEYLKKKEFSFSNVSADDLSYLVSYEDPKVCGASRNYLEGVLGSPKISEWTAERAVESESLPRKCIAFTLNSYPEIFTKEAVLQTKASSSVAFAKCKNLDSAPFMNKKKRIANPTPCVSKKFVNVTYNAYVDVLECLKLNPKELLPKIYNESGFFMNAFGSGMDGGVGQLTGLAIEQVNSIYPGYIKEMTQAALAAPGGACARIMKYKSLIAPAKAEPGFRCSLILPEQNPLRNLVYSAILTRYNTKYVSGISYRAGEEMLAGEDNQMTAVKGTSEDLMNGKMKEFDILKKLTQLGMKNVNLHDYKTMLVLVGYNSGIGTATNTLVNYLDQRIEANSKSKSSKYNLTAAHFDFYSTKDLVRDARRIVMSSHINSDDDAETKAAKIQRRKILPSYWASAYTRTFPEYLALRMNKYDGKTKRPFTVYGFPGYLNALANKNKLIRETFQTGGVDPNYCTLENFLKIK